jgi:hypothetical protein
VTPLFLEKEQLGFAIQSAHYFIYKHLTVLFPTYSTSDAGIVARPWGRYRFGMAAGKGSEFHGKADGGDRAQTIKG